MTIEGVIGPYAGNILSMDQATANQAIADKWARVVAGLPIDHDAEMEKALTPEENEKALEAANAFAAKVSAPPAEAKTASGPKGRTVAAEGTYETKAKPA
jgi:hypothetical protein